MLIEDERKESSRRRVDRFIDAREGEWCDRGAGDRDERSRSDAGVRVAMALERVDAWLQRGESRE